MIIPAIRTEAITKSFDGVEILSGIDLTVMPGEVVCIVGPSGSGKSTFLRCINRLSPATSGHVYLNGELFGERETEGGAVAPLQHFVLQRQRQRIGMVFQSFNLWPHRTALENVMEGPRIVQGKPQAEARLIAEALLERVGLSHRRNYYPAQLSGGQQQRVAIARALAMKPEVILFDEPTSALDPELVGEVLQVMQELAAGDTTMVVVTHEIGFAVEVADRMVLMDKGRIVEEGPPRQFVQAPKQERSRQFLQQVMSRGMAWHNHPPDQGAVMSQSLTTIPARHGKALRLAKGQAVKLINIYGTQVVDCWAWNAHDLGEHMSMEASRVWNQRLNPLVGDSFVTNNRNPILTLVEDTSPGVHDTFMAACDCHRYERLGVKDYHRNCLDNKFEAMAELGLTPPHPLLASFNIFMNIEVQGDGRALHTKPTVTRPGDYMILKAEMDCIVAFSACPQDIVPIQGQQDSTPKDAAFVVLDTGFANLPPSQTWVPETAGGPA